MDRIAIEICVETPDGISAAADGGADRIEICAALALGGLTPGPGLVRAAAEGPLPAHALVRPRAGGFELGRADLDACLADIAHMRAAGLAGVVVGASRGGRLDRAALALMVEAAGPLEVTLHRVVDTLADPERAVAEAADLGMSRVLTSGGAARAGDGAETIARMARAAKGRIEIMAGGGVTARAVPALIAAGAGAIHASCGRELPGSSVLGLAPARRTDAADIRALARAAAGALAA